MKNGTALDDMLELQNEHDNSFVSRGNLTPVGLRLTLNNSDETEHP